MEIDLRILASVVGAVIGFALSQSINLISYYRRPRFEVEQNESGVLSCWSANPPEDAPEIILGFHLKNIGRNPAKNVRIFLSHLRTARNPSGSLTDASSCFVEVRRPIDIIPSQETVEVRISKIDCMKRSAIFYLENDHHTEEDHPLRYMETDTLGARRLVFDIYITCDDQNSGVRSTIYCNLYRDNFAIDVVIGSERIIKQGIRDGEPWAQRYRLDEISLKFDDEYEEKEYVRHLSFE